MKFSIAKLSQALAVTVLLLMSTGDRTSQASIAISPKSNTEANPITPLVKSIRSFSYAATPQAFTVAEQIFQPSQYIAPSSGSQLHRQRQMALILRVPYPRLTPGSMARWWMEATGHPSYEQWKVLLEREANAVVNTPESENLNVIVGDSLSQWLPTDLLSNEHNWLNQGISGDTTQGVLNRLSYFADTNPQTIYVMAGINDLKNGVGSDQVLTNLEAIMEQLSTQHPQAKIVVQSILPTRVDLLPNTQIRRLNQRIEASARQRQIVYLDLHPSFVDDNGDLRTELTTDGLHLNRLGYQVWQIAISAL